MCTVCVEMCNVLLPPGVNPTAVKYTSLYVIHVSYIKKEWYNQYILLFPSNTSDNARYEEQTTFMSCQTMQFRALSNRVFNTNCNFDYDVKRQRRAQIYVGRTMGLEVIILPPPHVMVILAMLVAKCAPNVNATQIIKY
jgi:hypothetical protein